MQLDKWQRFAMVIGGFVLGALVLAGSAWGHLELSSVKEFLLILSSVLVGFGTAAGPSPKKPGSPPGSIEVAILFFCAVSLSACAGRQCPVPTPTAEQIEDAAHYVAPFLEDAIETAVEPDADNP